MGPLVWEGSYSFRRFFWPYIQRKFISVRLHQLINRTSSEFQPMHAYDQQSWSLFHRCESLSSFWTAENKSYRNHQMKLIIIGPSEPKKNQNTVEKNEFYEWRIWRTIMKTMNENSFICIKINSWSQYDRVPSAFLSIKRFSFYQSLSFYHHSFQQLAPSLLIWSDQTKVPPAFLSITGSIQTNISIAGPSEINGNFASIPFYHRSIQANIWFFFSWNNPPKTTSYGDFWWFSYRRIFPPIFLHGLNFEFHFNLSYQWNEWMINFDYLFIHEIELFEEVNIYDWIITKILKSCI